MEATGQIHAPAILLQGKMSGTDLIRRQGWPRIGLDVKGKTKNSLSISEFEPRIVNPVALSTYQIRCPLALKENVRILADSGHICSSPAFIHSHLNSVHTIDYKHLQLKKHS
jgi:hypothetical protein